MKTSRLFSFIVAFSLLLLPGMPAQEPDAIPEDPAMPEKPPLLPFKATTMAEASAEAMLPGNGIVHFRLNNTKDLILTVEKLALKALPIKSVPIHMKPFFEQPNPLLALFGMQMDIEGFNIETVGQITGLKTDQPITLSFYAGEPGDSLLLSVPSADLATTSNLLMNMLEITATEAISYGTHSGLKLTTSSRDLPRTLYSICSAGRIFIAGSVDLIELIGTQKEQDARKAEPSPNDHDMSKIIGPSKSTRLSDDPAIKKTLNDYSKTDLTATLSLQAFKPIVAGLAQKFATLPPQQIEKWKEEARTKIDDDVRQKIEIQLQQKLGVTDLEELMDLIECYGLPAYETLVALLSKELGAFHGITLSVDVREDFQKVHLTVYSDSVVPADAVQPIPMDNILPVFNRLPSDHGVISVSGRKRVNTASPNYSRWLSDVEGRLKAKGLSTELIQLLSEINNEQSHLKPLEAYTDWMLETSIPRSDLFNLKSFETLNEYADFLKKPDSLIPDAQIRWMPGDHLKSIDDHFESWRSSLKSQLTTQKKMNRFMEQEQNWLRKHIRLLKADKGPLKQWTLEEAFVTSGGLFGYHQHELINREIYYARLQGNLTALEAHSSDTPWLLDDAKPMGTSQAFKAILAQAPSTTNGMSIIDKRLFLLNIVDFIQQFEDLMHRDITAYLNKATAASNNATDDDDLNEQLMAMDIPLGLYSLNQDEQGNFYGVLPGDFIFPRPKVSKYLTELFEDYATKDNELGGSATFHTITPGKCEFTLVQSTDAIAHFIKTTGDKFITLYRDNPEGISDLKKQLKLEADQSEKLVDESVLINTTWSFLEPIMSNLRAKPEPFRR